ncbi:MAG: ABC transporter permease [Actinomycetota bacterium]|nr:ABC transporter permease [Actinomycetota bacterium]
MSVSAPTQTLLPGRARSRPSAFRRLAITELKLFIREPLTLLWGVVFPLVLLIVLGSATSEKPQRSLAGMRFIDAYVPVLMVFVLAILALNALPAALSNYRDKGYLRRLSTTPVGPVGSSASSWRSTWPWRPARWP